MLSSDLVRLSWPDVPGDGLEETVSLDTGSDWLPSAATPIVAAGSRWVVLPITTSQQFFRLQRLAPPQNAPPQLAAVSDSTIQAGGVLTIQLTAVDPDGDPLEFSVLPLPLPVGSVFDARLGRLEYRPGTNEIGEQRLTFSVSDGLATVSRPASITVTGPVAGGETVISGVVLDTTDAVAGRTQPVVGVRVSLLGVSGSVLSGADGRFRLAGIPAGPQVLDLDASAAAPAPDGSPYAGFREEIHLVGGVETVVPRPFYLPRLDASSLTTIDPSTTTLVQNTNLNITLAVPPHTAKLGETEFNGQLSISLVPQALAPAALPSFLEPGMLITLQPVGVRFTTPVPITFPNIDQLPPGTETDLWSLEAGTGRFVVVGKGRVTTDGQRIETISGGIRATDWHAPLPPSNPPGEPPDSPPDDDDPDDDCEEDSGSVVTLVSGVLRTDFELPVVYSLGGPRALRFVYSTDRAWPHPTLPGEVVIPVRAAVPRRVSFALTVGGIQHPAAYVDTSTLGEDQDESFRIAVDFDATGLPTGAYPYTLRQTSHYLTSRISGDFHDRVVVVNEQASPFGAGWGIDGLQRLTTNPDGSVLLTDGRGLSILFASPTRRDLLAYNTASTGILRFDGETGRLIGDFIAPGAGGLTQVHNPIFGPDGNVYVLNAGQSVLRFNGVTGEYIGVFIPPGTGLNGVAQMAWGPDGNLYTDLAGPNARQVFRWSGADGHFLGVAASGQGIQRACGIAFGPDGMLYVADQDPFRFTRYDRILRFNGATGEFLGIFVPSGNLDDTCPFEFGADGDLYIADQTFHDIRRFDGLTGAFKGVFASGAPIVNPVPFYARSGPDGLLYVANGAGIHRYRDNGTSGTFVDTFVSGPTGFLNFMPAPDPNRPIGYQSPAGDASQLVREVDGRFVRHLAHGERAEFAADGRLEARADRNGNRETYRYDPSGRLLEIVDPAGLSTRFEYVGPRLARVVDGAERVTQFETDAAGDLIRVTFPDGRQRAFAYDLRHLMVAETGPNGAVVRREFDRIGRLVSAVQPDGSRRSTQASRSRGLPDLAAGVGTAENPMPIVRSSDSTSQFTDGAGVQATYQTGAFGEGVRVIGGDGLATRWERDRDGNPTLTESPSGQVVKNSYDARGNMLTFEDAALGNATNRFAYDPGLQLLVTSTDALGQTTSIDRDAQGNILAIRSPRGRITRVAYNPRGQAVAYTNLLGTVQTNTYDALGRLIASGEGTGSRQRVVTYEYSAAGEITQLVEPGNRTNSLAYDPAGRLTRSTRPDGSELRLMYDAAGNLASVSRDGRAPHRYRHSIMDQLAEYLPPGTETGAGSIRYDHDAAQRLARTRRADGREVRFDYDAAGRIAATVFDGGRIDYSYDPTSGQLSRIAAGNVTNTYGYSGERITSATWAGPIRGSVHRTFDRRGLLATLTVTGSPAITYQYDEDQLLVRAGDLTLARDPASGLITQATLGDVTQTWAYDEFGDLTNHVARFGATLLLERRYVRGAAGEIVEIQETGAGGARSTHYTYDRAGRLGEVAPTDAPVRRYQYDANDNRTAAPNLSGVAVYDVQDRLSDYGGLAMAQGADGELESRGTAPGQARRFRYDPLGNLLGFETPGGESVEYVLDGRGRLVGRRRGGQLERGWLYSDESQIVAELDANSQVRTLFVQALIGAPDYFLLGSWRFAVIKDHLGSPRLVLDSVSGAIAQRLDYDEFGVVTEDTQPGFQPFGFAGGWYDAEAGLVRFGVRYYDAGLGRWISRDPEPPVDGMANLYTYAANDPVNQVDRTGSAPGWWSNLKGFGEGWATDQALQSLRDSIRNIHLKIQSAQKSINALNADLKRLRDKLAKTKDKKARKRLEEAIKIAEAAKQQLEQEQLNLNSDLAAAYRALNALKFGKWLPDNAFDPRNWLDPHRARFKPDW